MGGDLYTLSRSTGKACSIQFREATAELANVDEDSDCFTLEGRQASCCTTVTQATGMLECACSIEQLMRPFALKAAELQNMCLLPLISGD